ncbi:FbpB family small basic protein [Litchfieldia salsa]|uniref:Fur-regulated basic protein B n=1 Tax=Litchfieldia salsa TaxID=930152 RepID=A0A1H0WVL6_9BACI|nr:FbpB family small basic protein [Litchfieldia salsa]SDP94753.1 Fur-regulated basic protein B [Litchfieldia salsa]
MLKRMQTKKSLKTLILENKENLLKDKAELDRIEKRLEDKHVHEK